MIVRGGTFGPVATNSFVVADERGGEAIVVDPALGSRRWLEETLLRLEATPIAVLDTHGHWDHVVENHLWAADGLPVWVGAGDEDWLPEPKPFNPALFGYPEQGPGVTPERVLREGEVLEVGAMRLRLLATPGHSPGCMVALEESRGQALVGDLIFAQGIGRTDFPRSDPDAMILSLERLFAEVPPETRIHPGHGPFGVTLEQAAPYARMFM